MEVNAGSGMSCTEACFSKGRRVKDSCTCKKQDVVGVAAWLCQGVAAAFFASLEWCSCVYVDTKDGSEDDSNCAPLIPNAEKEDSSTQILKHN